VSFATQHYSVKMIANWLLDYADAKNVKLSNMSLNKLIYFAYESVLRNYGRKLTNAKIEAWDHGPVFREVYAEFKRFGAEPITDRAKRYNTQLDSVELVIPALETKDERVIIEAVDPILKLPAFILREMSHQSGGSWDRVWNHTTSSNPGMQITDEIILTSQPTSGSAK
jgi:uncharacterized phage-associated protein